MPLNEYINKFSNKFQDLSHEAKLAAKPARRFANGLENPELRVRSLEWVQESPSISWSELANKVRERAKLLSIPLVRQNTQVKELPKQKQKKHTVTQINSSSADSSSSSVSSKTVDSQRKQWVESQRCFRCKEIGHLKADCQQPKKKEFHKVKKAKSTKKDIWFGFRGNWRWCVTGSWHSKKSFVC